MLNNTFLKGYLFAFFPVLGLELEPCTLQASILLLNSTPTPNFSPTSNFMLFDSESLRSQSHTTC